jgi:hypothetical protein
MAKILVGMTHEQVLASQSGRIIDVRDLKDFVGDKRSFHLLGVES